MGVNLPSSAFLLLATWGFLTKLEKLYTPEKFYYSRNCTSGEINGGRNGEAFRLCIYFTVVSSTCEIARRTKFQ